MRLRCETMSSLMLPNLCIDFEKNGSSAIKDDSIRKSTSQPICKSHQQPEILDDWGKYWKYINENQLKQYSRQGTIPNLSKKDYIKWYNLFISFLNEKGVQGISEEITLQFLDYLKEEKQYRWNSIYSIWSGVKSIALVTLNLDFDRYVLCKRWLKQNGKGKDTKKASTFTDEDFVEFLKLKDRNLMREQIASIYGKYGRLRAVDYTNLYYDKDVPEHEGRAWIKKYDHS